MRQPAAGDQEDSEVLHVSLPTDARSGPARGFSRRDLLRLTTAVGAAAAVGAGAAPAAAGPVVKPLPPELFTVLGTNAEMRWPAMRGQGHLVPVDRFFVRNHTSTPIIDADGWRLAGLGRHAVDVMPSGLDPDYVTGGVDLGPVRRPMPVRKALDDVLVAYEMNGEPLPADHGHPVRLIVPRWIGIASIKWVGAIEVSDEPLFSPWNTQFYRLFGPDYPADGQPFDRQVIKSAFELEPGAVLPAGRATRLSGRSWSAGGAIRHVEVSTDGGRRWRRARPVGPPTAWQQWEIDWRPAVRRGEPSRGLVVGRDHHVGGHPHVRFGQQRLDVGDDGVQGGRFGAGLPAQLLDRLLAALPRAAQPEVEPARRERVEQPELFHDGQRGLVPGLRCRRVAARPVRSGGRPPWPGPPPRRSAGSSTCTAATGEGRRPVIPRTGSL